MFTYCIVYRVRQQPYLLSHADCFLGVPPVQVPNYKIEWSMLHVAMIIIISFYIRGRKERKVTCRRDHPVGPNLAFLHDELELLL